VWLGNDDDSPMKGVVGGSLPAAIWHRFMLAATRLMPVRPLPGMPAPAVSAAAPAAPARSGGLIDELLSLFRARASPDSYPPGGGASEDQGGY
jgi:penicillin-binding protein 1A